MIAYNEENNATTIRANGSWAQVASEGGGFGCNVTVSIPLLPSMNYKVDIGYKRSSLEANPTVVSSDAFGLTGTSKTVYIPAAATLVYVRITSRDGISGASSFNVSTTVNK